MGPILNLLSTATLVAAPENLCCSLELKDIIFLVSEHSFKIGSFALHCFDPEFLEDPLTSSRSGVPWAHIDLSIGDTVINKSTTIGSSVNSLCQLFGNRSVPKVASRNATRFSSARIGKHFMVLISPSLPHSRSHFHKSR
nr:hypothetical protein HmN_000133900 [Hymenolepis microstoma]